MADSREILPLYAQDALADLWNVEFRVRAIAALFRSVGGEIATLEEVFHGMSYVLAGLADEIDQIKTILELKI